MKKKLSELFEIKSGYTFRSSVYELPAGETRVMQARNILNPDNEHVVHISLDSTDHLIQHNDILFSNRNSFRACIFSGVKPTVASSSLLILRAKSSAASAQYVTAYLNSRKGQAQLSAITLGATIKSLTKASLGNIEIDLPPVADQHTIATLSATFSEYNTKMKRKTELYNQLLNERIGARHA